MGQIESLQKELNNVREAAEEFEQEIAESGQDGDLQLQESQVIICI